MSMRKAFLMIVLFCVTVPAFGRDAPLMRRDGFLLLWESIRRPAEETTRESFGDVLENDLGFLEIMYAKRRGILDEAELFRPDDSLLQSDAILWLMRTRNVAELPDMQRKHLPTLLQRYPIEGVSLESTDPVTERELYSFMVDLDGQLLREVHEVSLYAEDFHGRGTAFGETFDMNVITAAHRSFPHNTLVKVTNIDNDQSVVVRINDRGPYVHGRDMDLSLASFLRIAPRSQGILRATFERLGDEKLASSCGTSQMYQKRITPDVRFHRGVPHEYPLGKELVLGSHTYFVVRGITFPDGSFTRMQDWVGPKERFSFTPTESGEYHFLVGTKNGRRRELRMKVIGCFDPY
jgi:rare lipoprotein A